MSKAYRHCAYLAGLLDGEGNIGVYRSKNAKGYWGYAVNLNVANTDRRLMRYLVQQFGGVFHTKPTGFLWEPNGGKDRIQEILNSVLPYLVIKRQQAELVLGFIGLGREICPESRERFYKMTLELNQTGVGKQSPLPHNNKTDFAYLAAILDGEGHLRITKTKQYSWTGVCYHKSITVPNCNKSLMRYLQRHFGGVYKPCRRNNPNPKHSPSYVWALFGNKLQEDLLLAVLPYLIIKKQQATNILSMIRLKRKINPEERERLWKATTALNFRHSPQRLIRQPVQITD